MIKYIRNAEELILGLTDLDARKLMEILKIEDFSDHNPQESIIQNYNEKNREVIDEFYMNVYDDSELEYTRFAFGHFHNKDLPVHIDYLAKYFDRKRYNYRITIDNGEMIMQKSHFEIFFNDFLCQCIWIEKEKEVDCRIFGIEYVLLTRSEVIQTSSALSRVEKLQKLRTRLSFHCRNT